MKVSLRKQDGLRGFTLLEMMLSVAIFVLLITSAFSLVGAATELVTEVSEVQDESSLRLRFVETCRAAFASTSGSSTIEFDYFDRGAGDYDTYLTITRAPGAFAYGLPQNGETSHIVLAAESRPDGAIRSGVYYLSALEFQEARLENFQDLSARYLELVPRMLQLSWRFYDKNTGRWQPNLEGGLSTSLVEMTVQIESSSPPLRSVFHVINNAL